MSKRDGRKKVLFVSIGNACRSPMAEAIARLDAHDSIDAFSGGVMPLGSVAELTKQTLMKNGYWVEGLESKHISLRVWEHVDTVINMSGRAKEVAFPEYSKVTDWNVQDPYERPPEDYQRAFDTIRKRVRELAQGFRREYAANRVAERRSRSRLYSASPVYMMLNEWNDARIINISEDGLALSSNAILPGRPLQNLWIQFADSSTSPRAQCQIAWKSTDHKQVGIQFVGLTEEGRQLVRNWISAQASYVDFHIQIGRSRDEQNLRLEIQNGSCGENAAPEICEEAPIPAPAPSRISGSGLRSTTELQRGARATRGSRIRLLLLKVLSNVTNTGPSRRRWEVFAVVVILTAAFTLLIHSVATHHEVRSEARTEARQEPIAPGTIASGVSHPAAGEGQAALSPVTESSPLEKAGDVQHYESGADASRTTARPAKEPSRSTLIKTTNPDSDDRSQRRRPTKPATRSAAGASVSPARKSQPETVTNLFPVLPPLEVKLAETADLATNRFAEVHPAETNAKASSALPAKPTVATAPMTGKVSVLADPYPSLRANRDSSKKQRQGAASLQLGHLRSRVVPVYPEEAMRQGIQGTVKLHAVVDRHGSVKSMQPVSGPPILGAAVMNAVRQWQYTETVLADQPVETEVDVAVVFQISNPETPKL